MSSIQAQKAQPGLNYIRPIGIAARNSYNPFINMYLPLAPKYPGFFFLSLLTVTARVFASLFLASSSVMAAPWRNQIIDSIFHKIPRLQQRMDSTRENVQKLMEDSRREGTADDLRKAAENADKKIEELSEKLKKLQKDLGNHRSRSPQWEPYQKVFEELEKELDTIDQIVRENLLVLEIIQEPTEVEGEAEELVRSSDLLESKELQTSGNAASQTTVGNQEAGILLQDMEGMENFDGKKIQKETPSSNYGKSPLPPKNPTPKQCPVAAAVVRNEGNKKIEALNRLPTGTNRYLCDIIMDLYGFAREESQEIAMQVAKASTENPYQGTGSSTEARILNWEGVRKLREMFQSFKNQIVENEISGFFFKVWIFRVENQMFRHLRTFLGEFRQGTNGMVPIVVHRILALLESQGLVEQSDLNTDQQEALYRNLCLGEVIDSIYRMIVLKLRLALLVSGESNAVVRSPPVLEPIEEEMGRIEERIIEGRKNSQRKRKREDEPGGSRSESSVLS